METKWLELRYEKEECAQFFYCYVDMFYEEEVRVKKAKTRNVIGIMICILVCYTIPCYADVQMEVLAGESNETVMINGEEYVLVPAPAPSNSVEGIQPMDQINYDWKYANTNKTNKYFDVIASATLVVFMTEYLGSAVPALTRLADMAVGFFGSRNIGSANIYYTKDFYYAQNIDNYGGYPYYCKKVLYQYANSARTTKLYDDPAISYYYAYQPY